MVAHTYVNRLRGMQTQASRKGGGSRTGGVEWEGEFMSGDDDQDQPSARRQSIAGIGARSSRCVGVGLGLGVGVGLCGWVGVR